VWLAFGEFYRLSVHIQSQSDSSTRILWSRFILFSWCIFQYINKITNQCTSY
jgi:hypothetical protein